MSDEPGVYIVDTVEVEPADADEYVRTVHSIGVPMMRQAGARFVSCWATSPDLGEPVSVKTVWACRDHVEWNVIRRNLVLDPAWYAFAARIASMWIGGARRFYYPAGAPADA